MSAKSVPVPPAAPASPKSAKPAEPRKPLSKGGRIALSLFFVLFDLAAWYLLLPAINPQCPGFWFGILLILLELLLVAALSSPSGKGAGGKAAGKNRTVSVLGLLSLVLSLVLAAGAIVSTPMFFSGKYASLLQPEERVFVDDIPQSDTVSNIALMDTASARIIGSRAVGSLADIVSQFEVSENYTTIDLNGQPMKVASLEYADLFKYFNNRKTGIPGYVLVDPVNNEAQYVRLDDPIQYTQSAFFGKDLYRHLRFQYPFHLFEGMYFELDNESRPFYICPVLKANVGLFGARDVKGVVVLDPVDGSSVYYNVDEIPQWVDRVYDGDLLSRKYDWYGTLSGGFLNSLFGNVGCRKTTDDYGYKVMDGDVWVYTGVTSVNSDESNIGFVMMNSRTSECRYYQIAGAEEYSAMASAEGQVQHLGYTASFPSLINIDGQPTYIMVLKDNGGLVKLYAMVNVQKYNIVTTGTSQREVLTEYRRALRDSGLSAGPVTEETASFTIEEIRYLTVDGESWVYLTAQDGSVYKALFAEDETLIFLKAGDSLTVRYEAAENGIRTILSR